MTTTNKALNQPAYDAPNWDVPLNANFGYIDAALGTTTSISVAGVPGTPQVLSTTQLQSASLSFSGLLGNDVNYQIPSGVGGFWSIFNSTTGSFTLTISSGGAGTSQIIPQGQSRFIFSDGTNIKFPNNIGASGQVIYNAGATGPSGDANFTYASSVLSAPRARLGDGTEALPALAATASTGTGWWFPGVGIAALSTAGVQRFRVNASGALATGTASNYGSSGQVLKTLGNAAQADWGWAGAVYLGTTSASNTFFTISGLTLTPYKFLIIAVSQFAHNSGATQEFSFFDTVIGSAVIVQSNIGAGQKKSGMIAIELTSGVGMANMGLTGGGQSFATGFKSSVSKTTTSITISLTANTFADGNVALYGIA